MVEMTPEQTADAIRQTASLRNEIVDLLKRDGFSQNVSILAIVSLAEEIRGRMSDEVRIQTDMAAKAFNMLDSIEKTMQVVLVAGEN